MKKAKLIQQVVASLAGRLGVLEKAARASHAEATHESSKAESKFLPCDGLNDPRASNCRSLHDPIDGQESEPALDG